jgi:hypothetical protein
MGRLPVATLSFLVSLALACSEEEPTGPTGSGQPPMEAQPARPASAVITRTTAIDQQGNVGAYTSLVSGADGRQHVTYQDVANQDLRYATCATNCAVAGNWSKVRIDQTGAVGRRSSLEVGPNGRRHILYQDQTNQDLKYATCAPSADCTALPNWQKIPIDTLEDVGRGSAIALGADGQRHGSYYRRRVVTGGEIYGVRYATCSTNCGQVGSWTRVTVEEMPNPPLGWGEGLVTSIAIGPDGRRHISYLNPVTTDLRYATCLTGCTNPANWQKLTVDAGGIVGFHSSLEVGQDDVLHVSYYDYSNGDLKYARCALDCTVGANWKKVTAVGSHNVGLFSSLVVEANGRVHISATNATRSSLYYATCNADCIVSHHSWTKAELDGADSDVGWHTSLTVRNGVVRISYYDRGNGDLKYLTRTPLVNPF